MNRSELILALAEQNRSLTQPDIKKCVEVILNKIGDSVVDGHRTEVRGFGTFARHERRQRIGRNPKTGEQVNIPAKAAIHFKVSRDVLASLNPEVVIPEKLAA